MSPDINRIWTSLKNDSDMTTEPSRNTRSIAYLWQTGKHSKPKQRKGKRKEKKTVLSKTKSVLPGGEKQCKKNEILPVDKVSNSIPLHPTKLGLGDSDDDTDNEAALDKHRVESEDERLPKLTLQRIVSLMQSEDVSKRIEAMKNLFVLISNLHEKIEFVVPILDFPPPYDLTRITLTHRQNDAMVSDMAKGEYVKAWARWQRTKVPVSEQFPKRDKNKKACSNGSRDSNENYEESTASVVESLQRIYDFCGISIFHRFSDKSEVCRSYAINSMKLLCLSQIDIGKHLGFLMPVLLRKYPCMSFDDEMDVFVDNVDRHQFYKRGGATERQDRTDLLSGSQTLKVADSSEEIRLLLCELFSCIVRCFVQFETSTPLDAYFTDIILVLQSHLKDPFPKLKIAAANLLVQILRVPKWELGAKEFATAIARASIPNLRHRNSKVRLSAIYLFEASVSVPNREKIKGAGTAAISDLVGFREQNVLPISAFYKYECGVTVNTLAELVTDKSTSVRLACCQMLSFLVNCLPDRYDHHCRLLPYLLNFYHDDNEGIRICANRAIESCGEQYETENSNEIIERRQYGVDGDSRCNHIDALPFPFIDRPRLGARLFVRTNTKRFFAALLEELTSWTSKTRLQSAKLLCILIVYCEEHLTMDCHNTILGIVKALQVNMKDEGKESEALMKTLMQLLELMGRFIQPQTYIKILLPRVIGDVDSATTFSEGSTHSESSRVASAIAMCSMIKGTLPKILLPHIFTLIPALSTSLTLCQFEGTKIKVQWLLLLQTILDRTKDESISGAQSAYFDVTGRIHSSQEMIVKCELSLQQIMDNHLNEDESIYNLAKAVMEQLN